MPFVFPFPVSHVETTTATFPFRRSTSNWPSPDGPDGPDGDWVRCESEDAEELAEEEAVKGAVQRRRVGWGEVEIA